MSGQNVTHEQKVTIVGQMCKASGQLSHWEKIIIRRLNVKLWHFALLIKSECSLCVGNAIRPLWVQTSLGQNVTLEVQTGLNVTRMFRGCTFHRGIYPYCRLIPQYVGIYMYLYMNFIYFSKDYLLQKTESVVLKYPLHVCTYVYYFFRIANVCCFHFPNYIFKIKFWTYKVFFSIYISFQELCISNGEK
jgi:hypothetical protein